MGKRNIEQDLRRAGLRKKRSRKLSRAAAQSRSGDRAARDLLDQHVAALRASLAAVVSSAKPPRSKSTRKSTARKSTARKPSARKTSARKPSARKSTARKRPERKSTARKR